MAKKKSQEIIKGERIEPLEQKTMLAIDDERIIKIALNILARSGGELEGSVEKAEDEGIYNKARKLDLRLKDEIEKLKLDVLRQETELLKREVKLQRNRDQMSYWERLTSKIHSFDSGRMSQIDPHIQSDYEEIDTETETAINFYLDDITRMGEDLIKSIDLLIQKLSQRKITS